MLATLPCVERHVAPRLNVALLREVCKLLESDPYGFDMKGASVSSTIPARNHPVNLREHIAHVLGLDYSRRPIAKVDDILSRVLGLSFEIYLDLVCLTRWPEFLRTFYEQQIPRAGTVLSYPEGPRAVELRHVYQMRADAARSRLMHLAEAGK